MKYTAQDESRVATLACVPLAPAKTQCLGRSSANLENPIFSVGN